MNKEMASSFQTVNKLPIPLWQRLLFWGGLRSTLSKLNKVYRYREKNEEFVDAYIDYFLWKHDKVLKANVDPDSLSLAGELGWLTMKGVSNYWLDNKEKAFEYLKKANRRGNFLM